MSARMFGVVAQLLSNSGGGTLSTGVCMYCDLGGTRGRVN